MRKLDTKSFLFWLAVGVALCDGVAGVPPLLAQTFVGGHAEFYAGTGPHGIVVADFNHDGRPDLAVSNGEDNTVSVLLATASGSYSAAINSATGQSPFALAAGDFNGDSKLDIAVADANSFAISILLGNGDGTFQPHVDYAAGSYPEGIVVGDFNADGKLDAAVENLYDNTVSVFFGNGDGTMQPQVAVPVGSAPESLVTGDFNQDGKTDLATANGGDLTVTVLLNNGNKSFTRVNSSSGLKSSPGNVTITAGDFNKDGKLDAIVTGSTNYQVLFLAGKGDGSLTKGVAVSSAPLVTVNTVAAGDFNHDGNLDLVIPGIYVLLGKGDGTFGTAVLTPFNYVNGMVVADLDGDGQIDVAATDNAGLAAVLLGNGHGGLGTFSNSTLASSLSTPAGAVGADFNGDGKVDIAVVGCSPTGGELSVSLGDGKGKFGQPIVSNLPSGPLNSADFMLSADFNGDGKTDLLTPYAYAKGFQVALSNGDGTFVGVSTPLTYGVIGMAAGDFNGDGKADVAVTQASPDGFVNIFLGKGDGTFTAGAQYSADLYASVTAADVNLDGKLDLIVVSSSLQIYLGNGNGTFQSPLDGPGSGYASRAVVEDFNGDGLPDLAIGSFAGVQFLAGNGNGTFRDPVVSNPLFILGGFLVAADLSGDGMPDLISSAQAGGVVAMISHGDGTFGTPNAFAATGLPGGIAAADFNSDGVADIALADQAFTSPFLPVALVYASAPTANLFPTTLNFGSVQVGKTSARKKILLTNAGNAPLILTSVAVSGPFLDTDTCAASLVPGANCAIHVSFKPTAKGPATGTITIRDNLLSSPQTISLSGTGN